MENIYPRRVPVIGNLTGNGWTVASQESVLSLIVVLGSSVSLVGLIFAFITYRFLTLFLNIIDEMSSKKKKIVNQPHVKMSNSPVTPCIPESVDEYDKTHTNVVQVLR
ncbi:Hypothetical protein CINCED_3A012620 [Cinara cedri]|uniref:Uncharacterized protein n=1 Tax=Cinara cedri TaxID=506608 RepID=A0A5E4M265_9HEMI|nr:Hypothetical protein CINCED_3A012620 [Cinara cedri]